MKKETFEKKNAPLLMLFGGLSGSLSNVITQPLV
jgi:hypothetical protein